MATTPRESSGAESITALATTGTAIAAVLMALRRREPISNEVLAHLDEETMVLLTAQAQAVADILNVIKNLGLVVQGYPPNTPTFVTDQLICQAANTAYQLPAFEIPEGFQLLLKGHPNNAGFIYVGKSQPDCTNFSHAWPLLAQEMIGLALKDTSSVWVASNMVNQIVCYAVEQK